MKNYRAILWVFFATLVCPCGDLVARSKKGVLRTVPGGIVFPSFSDSVRTNPAYLPTESARVAQLFYQPPSASIAPGQHDAEFSLASASRGFGYGINYRANISETASPQHGLSIGLGGGTSIFKYGLSLEANDIEMGFKPDINLSLRGEDGNLVYQANFNNLDEDAQLELGIGLSDEKKYSLELNLSLPTFAEISSSVSANYQISLALSVIEDTYGASARTSFDTETLTHSHRFSFVVRPIKELFVTTEVSYPLRYRVGVGLDF